LITKDQIIKFNELSGVANLFTKNGLLALAEKLISYDELIAMGDHCTPRSIGILLSDHGLAALREGLIKANDFAAESFPMLEELILSKNGLTALREGLMTPQAAYNNFIYPYRLREALTEEGLNQLRASKVCLGR
jgi:hypothetical protein